MSQYPRHGVPGISYVMAVTANGVVDCLLWRDTDGDVRGILNHYPHDIPPFEHAGNVNMWVGPGWKRTGIGTALITEADRRWHLNFEQQSFTTAGLALARRYRTRALRSK